MKRWAGALIRGAGVTVVLHGEEHITAGGGVYICNHVSWFDVFAIASKLPRCTFVAKHELRGIPVFGWGAESAGGVCFCQRDNPTRVEDRQVTPGRVPEALRSV